MHKPIDIIRKNIRKYMEYSKWNQADLSRALGWPPMVLSNYLNHREPRMEKLQEIANVFGVHLWTLFKSDMEKPMAAQSEPHYGLTLKIAALDEKQIGFVSVVIDELKKLK